jgi:hypothetical protein
VVTLRQFLQVIMLVALRLGVDVPLGPPQGPEVLLHFPPVAVGADQETHHERRVQDPTATELLGDVHLLGEEVRGGGLALHQQVQPVDGATDKGQLDLLDREVRIEDVVKLSTFQRMSW